MRAPVLQAMVVADHVYRDSSTGKHIIAGTFTMMVDASNDAKPTHERSGTPFLYLALYEVFQQTVLELRFVRLSDGTILWNQTTLVTSPDPLSAAEIKYALPRLPVAGPGDYSLDVLHDGAILGSWRIKVLERETSRENANADVRHGD